MERQGRALFAQHPPRTRDTHRGGTSTLAAAATFSSVMGGGGGGARSSGARWTHAHLSAVLLPAHFPGPCSLMTNQEPVLASSL